MMAQLNRAWSRRPRLGRGARTVKNFLLAALLLLYFWGASGYHLPTRELERGRAWRQNLMPAGVVVMEKDSGASAQVVTVDADGITLGVASEDGDSWDVLRYPREDFGVTVIPLPRPVQTQAENHQTIYLDAVLAMGLPSTARTVWMDLTLDWGLGSRTWKGLRGVSLEHGGYLFLYNQDELPDGATDEEWAARSVWLAQLDAGGASGQWSVEVQEKDGSRWIRSGRTATRWGLEDDLKPGVEPQIRFTQGG